MSNTKLWLLKIGLAIVSFVGWIVFFNIKVAVVLMLAVGWHEYSHIIALNNLGIKNFGFFYIPLLGGAAIPKQTYPSYYKHALVSIAGPFGGAILAWFFALLYAIWHLPIFGATALLMALFNVLNLIPVNPLDGGKIVRSINFSINKWFGLGFLLASVIIATITVIKMKSFWLALIIPGALLDLCHTGYYVWFKRKENDPEARIFIPQDALDFSFPTTMNKKELAITIGSYLFTIGILVLLIVIMKSIPAVDIYKNFVRK